MAADDDRQHQEVAFLFSMRKSFSFICTFPNWVTVLVNLQSSRNKFYHQLPDDICIHKVNKQPNPWLSYPLLLYARCTVYSHQAIGLQSIKYISSITNFELSHSYNLILSEAFNRLPTYQFHWLYNQSSFSSQCTKLNMSSLMINLQHT